MQPSAFTTEDFLRHTNALSASTTLRQQTVDVTMPRKVSWCWSQTTTGEAKQWITKYPMTIWKWRNTAARCMFYTHMGEKRNVSVIPPATRKHSAWWTAWNLQLWLWRDYPSWCFENVVRRWSNWLKYKRAEIPRFHATTTWIARIYGSSSPDPKSFHKTRANDSTSWEYEKPDWLAKYGWWSWSPLKAWCPMPSQNQWSVQGYSCYLPVGR